MARIDEIELPEVTFGGEVPTTDPRDAYTPVEEAREVSPLARTPFGVMVLRHEDVSRLLHDPRLRGPGQDMLLFQGITEGVVFEANQEVLLFMEGEDHHRLRRLVAKAFTPKAVDRLRPMMRESFAERLDAVAGQGRCEAVADLCESYPIEVICALVGAPRQDWPRFGAWAEGVLRSLSFEIGDDLPHVEQCIIELSAYVDDLVAERRRAPQPDLLSELIAVEEQGDRLSGRELRAVVRMILVAGSDTTRNQLGLALHTFATHPDQWRLLGDQPELAPAAVEETTRYLAATAGLPRVALEDIDLHGITIPAGTFVVLSSESANHDPRAIERPDELDITRTLPPGYHHLTFGGGIHYCLGAALARAELQEALALAAPRLRALALDGEPSWRPTAGIFGPSRLPVRWDTTVQ